MTTRVTATVITLNAAATLDRCLRSVAWVDEILVIDSGSTDNTVEIAWRWAHRVEHQDWMGYGAQKAYAATLAQHDWILSLDADEWLSPELSIELQALRSTQLKCHGYLLNCRNRFLGRWLKHGEGYPDWHLRFFDRRYGNWQIKPVHEQVYIQGPIESIFGDLMHDSAQSLSDYLTKQNRYTQLQAELLWKQGRRARIWDLMLRPMWRFIRLYFIRRGFLDGMPGLIHISIGCFNTFMKYAKLWEWRYAARNAILDTTVLEKSQLLKR